MAVTQKKIAKRAGVSQTLVGSALRGNGRISEETRLRVLSAASEMGYSEYANGAARSMAALRNGKKVYAGVLALLLPDAPFWMEERSYFAPLVQGVAEEACARELEVAYLTLHHFGPLPRLLINGGTDGVIAVQWDRGSLASSLLQHNVPLVWLSVHGENGVCVLPDERAGAALAASHLLELGHRRIAYIGYKTIFESATERFEGFCNSLKQAGCFDLSLAEYCELEGGAVAVQNLLQRAPDVTAIFCYNDFLAMDVTRELQRLGRRVPEDVSVVGFDATSREHNFVPTLTSVSYDRVAMGRRAVTLLLDRIQGGEREADIEALPVSLATGASSAALKV